MRIIRQYLLILCATLGLVLMPAEAMAYEYLYCDGSGGVGGGEFFPATDGGACEYTGLEHVLSQIICDFVVIINVVLGKVYCGMQYVMAELLYIVITLYIAIFGVQILMGTSQLNSREMIVRMLKIAGVWTFVTNSTWGINMAFNFFISSASQGIWWALGAIPSDITIDSSTGVMPLYVYFDELIYNAIFGPFTNANSELIGFFAIMSYLVLPLFMMAAYWLWITFTILARGVISFMMGISAIAFLISLSPIFLSFMLFNTTYQFFENWLKFMISYTLQIVLVFVCIVMWILAMNYFVDFFDQLSSVIFRFGEEVVEEGDTATTSGKLMATGNVTIPVNTLGICPYDFSLDASFRPTIECTNPGFDPFNNPDDRDKLILLQNISQKQEADSNQHALNKLIYFVVFHLTSLIIVCYAFDALLKQTPSIAKQLAGPQYVPILGQGWGNTGFGSIKSGQSYIHRATDGQKSGGISDNPLLKSAGKAVTDILKKSHQQIQQRRS